MDAELEHALEVGACGLERRRPVDADRRARRDDADTRGGLPTRIARPRVFIYGGLLGALVIGFVVAVAMRSPVSLDVLRDRNSLYRLTDDGNVDNVYTLRILNKTEHEQHFRLEAHGGSPLTLVPGGREYRVASGDVYSLPLRVRRAAYDPPGPETIELTVRSVDNPGIEATTKARFLAPTRYLRSQGGFYGNYS